MTPGDGEAPPGQPGGEMLSAAVLARLEAMSDTLVKVAGRLETVAARERRTRRLTLGLVVSIVLDVTLTIVVSVLSANALSQGSTLHKSQLAACAIGNQTRRGDVELWGYVLKLSAKSPDSNQAQLRMFKAFVDKTFAPVDCAKLYR
jgi:hypothetical protein